MDAYKVPNSDKLGIVFTKILDQSSLISDDDKTQETTDKRFWEAKKLTTFAMVDDVLPIINDGKENKYELNYTKVYISVKRDQSPMSIIAFEPQQQFLLTKFKINQNPDVDRLIDNAHFSAVLPYDPSFKNYRIKLSKQDVESNEKK